MLSFFLRLVDLLVDPGCEGSGEGLFEYFLKTMTTAVVECGGKRAKRIQFCFIGYKIDIMRIPGDRCQSGQPAKTSVMCLAHQIDHLSPMFSRST